MISELTVLSYIFFQVNVINLMHLSFLCAMLIVSNSQCRSTGLQQKVLVLDLTLKAKSLLTSLSHSNKEFYECMACIFSYN